MSCCMVAAINFMIYFGNNRSSVIQCALASIMVLLILLKMIKIYIKYYNTYFDLDCNKFDF